VAGQAEVQLIATIELIKEGAQHDLNDHTELVMIKFGLNMTRMVKMG
jgi:hypothetical protein